MGLFTQDFYTALPGKIEATVKSMKKIISLAWNGQFLDDDKFCCALLQYRNTPSRRDGTSSAQKLYGHPVQDILPAHHHSFSPEWQQNSQEVKEQANQTSQSSEAFYNTHALIFTLVQMWPFRTPNPSSGIFTAIAQDWQW